MEDRHILDCIHALVAQERRLRDLRERDEVDPETVADRLAEIGTNLEQMWDLLRHRRALRAEGRNPDTIDLRITTQVAVPAF